MNSTSTKQGILSTLTLLLLYVLSLFVRVYDLNYNGPFVDESLYAVIKYSGNVYYLTCEAYLWPLIANLLYKIGGGIILVRVLAAIFGIITMGVVYRITRIFMEILTGNINNRFAPFFAALIFSLSAPAIYISRIGGPDAMAFMLYAIGLLLTAEGLKKNNYIQLLAGAIVTVLSFFTRYMLLMYLPITAALTISWPLISNDLSLPANQFHEKLKPVYIAFWLPFVTVLGFYWIFNHYHILSSVCHSLELQKMFLNHTPLTRLDVMAMIINKIPLVVITAPIGIVAFIFEAIRRRSSSYIFLGIFLLGSTLLVVAYHLFQTGDYAMKRNLTAGLIFGSILAGIGIGYFIDVLRNRNSRKIITALLLLSIGLVYLSTIDNMQADEKRWPDYRPISEKFYQLKHYLPRHGQIWSTFDETSLVWQLKAEAEKHADAELRNRINPYSARYYDYQEALLREKPTVIVGDRVSGYRALWQYSFRNWKTYYISVLGNNSSRKEDLLNRSTDLSILPVTKRMYDEDTKTVWYDFDVYQKTVKPGESYRMYANFTGIEIGVNLLPYGIRKSWQEEKGLFFIKSYSPEKGYVEFTIPRGLHFWRNAIKIWRVTIGFGNSFFKEQLMNPENATLDPETIKFVHIENANQ